MNEWMKIIRPKQGGTWQKSKNKNPVNHKTLHTPFLTKPKEERSGKHAWRVWQLNWTWIETRLARGKEGDLQIKGTVYTKTDQKFRKSLEIEERKVLWGCTEFLLCAILLYDINIVLYMISQKITSNKCSHLTVFILQRNLKHLKKFLH